MNILGFGWIHRIAAIFAFCAIVLWGQSPIRSASPGGTIILNAGDTAVLETAEARQDLPCVVKPIEPVLGFDFRYHSGYQVTIPLRSLAGSGIKLLAIFRVIPQSPKAKPVYFRHQIAVPALAEDLKGDAVLYGVFDLGKGAYRVDWLMRNRRGHVCSSHWDARAEGQDGDGEAIVTLAPGTVVPAEVDLFKEEPPVLRAGEEESFHVKILLNLAPQDPQSATLQPVDKGVLISTLRYIHRNPHIRKVSLVAFNVKERRVVHRQDGAEKIDFSALGKALESVNPGTVDYGMLLDEGGDTRFLEDLIRREVAKNADYGAIIFTGPKVMLQKDIPEEALRDLEELRTPVFYLNNDLDPTRAPWRDSLASIVKFFRGTRYVIRQPRDLSLAVKEVVSTTLRSKGFD